MAKRSKRKTLENKLDKLWSQLVRHKNGGKCVICGEPARDPHHIFPRARRATRWDLDNGIPLCFNHHRYRGAHSTEYAYQRDFHKWLEKNVQIHQLEIRSLLVVKHTIQDLEDMIEELTRRLDES